METRIVEDCYAVECYKIFKERAELRLVYVKKENKIFYDEKKATAKELLDFYKEVKTRGYKPKIEEIGIIC